MAVAVECEAGKTGPAVSHRPDHPLAAQVVESVGRVRQEDKLRVLLGLEGCGRGGRVVCVYVGVCIFLKGIYTVIIITNLSIEGDPIKHICLINLRKCGSVELFPIKSTNFSSVTCLVGTHQATLCVCVCVCVYVGVYKRIRLLTCVCVCV